MRFEIINPHDPYTMDAPDMEIAAVAICLLGNGAYSLKGLDDAAGDNVPPFVIGGHDEWFNEQFGADFNTVATRCVKGRATAMALTLLSVALGRPTRSSAVDLCAEAYAMAGQVLDAAADA